MGIGPKAAVRNSHAMPPSTAVLGRGATGRPFQSSQRKNDTRTFASTPANEKSGETAEDKAPKGGVLTQRLRLKRFENKSYIEKQKKQSAEVRSCQCRACGEFTVTAPALHLAVLVQTPLRWLPCVGARRNPLPNQRTFLEDIDS